MSKSASSRRWLRRQQVDPYVKRARERGYRSRAVFKLEEIDRRYRLFKSGNAVVDLGASPGAWSQYALSRTAPHGTVIASDILPMEPVQGVEFIQGDFRDLQVLNHLLESLRGESADVVMSDMAPNMTGVTTVDQPRAMYLAELALDLAEKSLRPGGSFLVKLFHGEDFDTFVSQVRHTFATVLIKKPSASRRNSREVYLLARGKL